MCIRDSAHGVQLADIRQNVVVEGQCFFFLVSGGDLLQRCVDPVSYTHLNQIDAFLKAKNLYKKGESKITFTDVQDCLIFVSSSFSTQTSYELSLIHI